MSNVQHQQFQHDIHVDGIESHMFLAAMDTTLSHIVDMAAKIGHTVDWSTLSVSPSDTMEIKTSGGGAHFYRTPVVLTVDTLKVSDR